MTQTKPPIPQGYKQTPIGIIPKDWEVKRLEELGINVKSGSNKTKKETGAYRVFGSTGVIGYCDKYIYDEKLILCARVGANAGFIYSVNEKCDISDNTLIISNFTNINSKFYEESLKKFNLNKLVFGSGQPLVTGSILKKLQLPIPPLAEQKKIADCLTTWDRVIEQLSALIQAKKQYKKGLMQQLLTRKKRLNGFNEEWKEVNLGEVFILKKGKGLSKSHIVENGKNKCILYGELYTKYSEVIQNVISHTNETNGFLSKKGDILVPSSTTTNGWDLITSSCILEDNVILGGDIIVLRPKGKVNSIFFSYLFTNSLQRKIIGFTQGVTIIHLYGLDIIKLKILLPSLEEQTAIAEILSAADREIGLLEKKKTLLETQKKGLMQQLLTGKKRLV